MGEGSSAQAGLTPGAWRIYGERGFGGLRFQIKDIQTFWFFTWGGQTDLPGQGFRGFGFQA